MKQITIYELGAFNIAPFDGGWRDSLMECGKCK